MAETTWVRSPLGRTDPHFATRRGTKIGAGARATHLPEQVTA
jgi:hypothetical protein